jgi:hypothetical protein
MKGYRNIWALRQPQISLQVLDFFSTLLTALAIYDTIPPEVESAK